ncbi:PspC domain-containing protein [Paeniglutamicibacter cryotolerans]|uniref:Phage shock protein PspC (Stress-responsive transcriptional regulator) n=1 Tax=Paeniglutamicibacter cryotolerans TaxID=670079 RepID=A0A839QCY2_9MICC|nr:PspC domain-containing protein [Paeniglutamicibacter cryotolerans]MBB2993989.1 phage shock protein PspC (stress-responsive transcriptional regulator) [Paeniglutamicibacter cryotolerans]
MNEAPVENGFFRWVRTLGVNRSEHGWIGGVASGIGARFGIDPVLARGIMVVLALFGGFGIAAYGLAWALLPGHDGRIHLQEAARGRWASGMTGALIFFIVGSVGEPWGVGWWGWDGGWGWIWPVGAVALVLWLVLSRESPGADADGSTRTSRFKAAFGQQGPRGGYSTAAQSTHAASTTGTIPPLPEDATDMNNTSPTDPASGTEPGPVSLHKPPADSAGFGSGFDSGFDAGFDSGYQPPAYVPAPAEPRAPRIPRAHPLPGYQGAIVLGIAALAAGLILALENMNVISLGASPVAVALAAALLVIGIGVIAAAVRRHTGGVLIGLGIPVLVLSLVFGGTALGSASRTAWIGGITDQTGNAYTYVFHSGQLDLTGYSTITQNTTLTVDNVFSSVDIAVPGNIPVVVESTGVFSSLELRTADGVTGTSTSSGQLNPGATGPTLTIKLDGAFTSATVTSQKATVTP